MDGKMEEAPIQGPLVASAVAGSLQPVRDRDSHALLGVHRDTQRVRHKGPSHHRPLSRTQSSPLVAFSVPPQSAQDSGPVTYTFTTGELPLAPAGALLVTSYVGPQGMDRQKLTCSIDRLINKYSQFTCHKEYWQFSVGELCTKE